MYGTHGPVRGAVGWVSVAMTGRTCACAQIVYYDGQFNDARLNVALAQTAALAGATVLNYTEVKALIKVQSPFYLSHSSAALYRPLHARGWGPFHAG